MEEDGLIHERLSVLQWYKLPIIRIVARAGSNNARLTWRARGVCSLINGALLSLARGVHYTYTYATLAVYLSIYRRLLATRTRALALEDIRSHV